MSSIVAVNTYTHNVTYVTDKMLLSLRRIIKWIGLNPNKLIDSWRDIDLAVKTWLNSSDLQTVVLEIYNPRTDAFVGGWDFKINYGYGVSDDGTMWVDTEAIRFAILKCGISPLYCDYCIILEAKLGRPDVPGWGPTTYRSRDGFIRQAVGTTIGTSGIGTNAGYWRKK